MREKKRLSQGVSMTLLTGCLFLSLFFTFHGVSCANERTVYSCSASVGSTKPPPLGLSSLIAPGPGPDYVGAKRLTSGESHSAMYTTLHEPGESASFSPAFQMHVLHRLHSQVFHQWGNSPIMPYLPLQEKVTGNKSPCLDWGARPFLVRGRRWEYSLLLPRHTLEAYSKLKGFQRSPEEGGKSLSYPQDIAADPGGEESKNPLPFSLGAFSDPSPLLQDFPGEVKRGWGLFLRNFQERIRLEREDPFGKTNTLLDTEMSFQRYHLREMARLSLSSGDLYEHSRACLKECRALALLAFRDSLQEGGKFGELYEQLRGLMENFKAAIAWRYGEVCPRLESHGEMITHLPLVYKGNRKRKRTEKPFNSYIKACLKSRGNTVAGELEILEGLSLGQMEICPKFVFEPFREEVKIWALRYKMSRERGEQKRQGVRILLLGGEVNFKGERVPFLRNERDKWKVNFFNLCIRF